MIWRYVGKGMLFWNCETEVVEQVVVPALVRGAENLSMGVREWDMLDIRRVKFLDTENLVFILKNR